MNRIDVICEPENLPRIRLLANHMQTLQIELVLHDETPSDHSNRVIYVPKRKDSRFKTTPKDSSFERIALYLDEDCQAIDAEMAVELVSWPGRSSDEAVARLASYLHRPFNPTTQTAKQTSNSRSNATPAQHAKDAMARVKQKLTATSRNRAERRNTLILAATAAVVVGIFSWLDLDTSRVAKQEAPPSKQTLQSDPQPDNSIADTGAFAPTEAVAETEFANTITGDSTGAVEGAALPTAEIDRVPTAATKDYSEAELIHPTPPKAAPMPARQTSSSTINRPVVAQVTAQGKDHTYLICATQKDRLRGLLLTAPYFHSEPCFP